MERTLYKELIAWKNQTSRLPLIVRGARQVGKSYLVQEFGKKEFEEFHVLNFEKSPHLCSCFDSLDPKEILKELELRAGIKLSIQNSLLFLDEIQDCPQALKSLRYFAEEMSELSVIAAGSLLEFVLEDKNFSFPVGRVQMMNLGPLNFREYLLARGKDSLVKWLDEVQLGDKISEGTHQRLLSFVKEFFCVGGMPGVVSTFLSTDSFQETARRQSSILDLYALDFGKYSTKHSDHRHLKKLFQKAPNLVGKLFKFSKVDPDCANPARDYREALHRLQQARLILPVHLTKGTGLPLRAEMSEKKFKIFLLDVGLLVLSLGWDGGHLSVEKESSLFRGILSEQFVAQELSAIQDPFIDRGLYFWENAERSSHAEIDFLVNLNQSMTPIEVKSGSTGRLKSLRQFMESRNLQLGVKISEDPLSLSHEILSVPFYLVHQLGRLLSQSKKI